MSGRFVVIGIAHAVLWSCQYYKLCRIALPWFWAVVCSCVTIWLCHIVLPSCGLFWACACSMDGPVTGDSFVILSWPWAILALLQNPFAAFRPPDTPTNLTWRPPQTYAWAEFLGTKIRGTWVKIHWDISHPWGWKLEVQLCGHFNVVNPSWGSQVNLSCHVRPKKRIWCHFDHWD